MSAATANFWRPTPGGKLRPNISEKGARPPGEHHTGLPATLENVGAVNGLTASDH